MRGVITFKAIRRLNAYKKPIVIAGIVAMIMALLVSCEQAYISSVKVAAPTSGEIVALSEEIKQSVTELEYSDKVAEDFVKMVVSWKDKQRRPVLVVWKKQLAKVKEDHKQGIISIDQLAKAEESIAKEVSQRIKKELSYNEKIFGLDNVIKHKQAQCLGYAQLFYILGDSIGLSIKPINVVELAIGTFPSEAGHAACIVSLDDRKTLMVDPGFKIVGARKPFKLEKKFKKVGNYLELKDKNNPLKIHRRIQILDRNGLIAFIYSNRGTAYSKLDQYDKAVSDYTKAIELNPICAIAYNNRGSTYDDLGQYDKAISDCTKAIELNPTFAVAYTNRGSTYDDLGQYDKAISDCTRAIELNPTLAEAYCNRGNANFHLGQHDKAISDYTRTIELNPTLAEAYSNRGLANRKLGQYDKAISDHTRAIELNPEYTKAYLNRGVANFLLDQYAKAISDHTKAIELNPEDAEAYYSRGIAYVALNKNEEAKKDLAKAVELRPAYETSVKEIYDKYKLNLKRPQTVAADRQHNLASIKKELLRLVDNNTDNIESISMRASIGASGNGSGQIIVKMKSSVLLGLPELMEKLGIKENSPEFKSLQNSQYAEFVVDVSSGKYSFGPSLRSRRFKSKLNLKGNYDRAISDSTKAIKLNPKNAGAYNERGNAYVGLGQYAKAISDYSKAIELNPKLAEAYFKRGFTYIFFLKKTEEAKKDLVKAVELRPAYKTRVKEISNLFKLNLKLD